MLDRGCPYGTFQIPRLRLRSAESRQHPSCSARGSASLDALRQGIARNGLQDKVLLTQCGSIGLCERVQYGRLPRGRLVTAGVSEEMSLRLSNLISGKGLSFNAWPAGCAGGASEICGNRDRFLASMKAKDAAGALPDEFMQTVRGFQESRIILTAIELDLFSAVARAQRPAQSPPQGNRSAGDGTAAERFGAMGLLSKSAGTSGILRSLHDIWWRQPDDSRSALTHWLHLWIAGRR